MSSQSQNPTDASKPAPIAPTAGQKRLLVAALAAAAVWFTILAWLAFAK